MRTETICQRTQPHVLDRVYFSDALKAERLPALNIVLAALTFDVFICRGCSTVRWANGGSRQKQHRHLQGKPVNSLGGKQTSNLGCFI